MQRPGGAWKQPDRGQEPGAVSALHVGSGSQRALPLGAAHAPCIAPQSKPEEEKRSAHAIPIEEKKTFVWLEHHRDLVALSAKLPRTRLVHVCDREADFFWAVR